MKRDLSQIDKYSKEEIESMHDEVHVLFNKSLNGEKIKYSFRELHSLHNTLQHALIRAGGIHISPIDQLDKIQMLEEENKTKKKITKTKKEEFILLEYFKEEEEVKNLWALQIGKKIFEFESNPINTNLLFSIKKDVDAKGKILDKGDFKILTDNEKLLSIEFLGENFKGIYNFKRNHGQSNVWKLTKEGASEELREKFGESLSHKEIRTLYFLSSNKVGASEIANLMSRPVQTIYSWIGKLKK